MQLVPLLSFRERTLKAAAAWEKEFTSAELLLLLLLWGEPLYSEIHQKVGANDISPIVLIIENTLPSTFKLYTIYETIY